MKFLIDAQLPARLAEFLNRAGHDALHTIGLPDGDRSTDSQIAQHADTENRVVVTKDQDFRDGHLLGRSPRKLLVVASGNITNDALLSLFELHLDAIVSALGEADLVELTQDASRWAGARTTPPADAAGDRNRPSGRRSRRPPRPRPAHAACRNRPRSRTAGPPAHHLPVPARQLTRRFPMLPSAGTLFPVCSPSLASSRLRMQENPAAALAV